MPHFSRHLLSSTALTQLGLLLAGLACASSSALALPQDGQVVGGSATIAQTSATQLDINQTSARAVLDWHSFSIGAGETTNFHQPSPSSVAVNRVTGVDPSTISGHLNANGQVVLVNPNGILFSQGASVNVGGLVATTTGISVENAMAGNFVFDQASRSSSATVVNQGKITAAEGGLVALVAPGVANSGVIRAKLGKVSLASGNAWTLDLYGDHLVNFAVDGGKVTQNVSGPAGTEAGVNNSGKIYAAAGTVEITADVAKGIVSNAINTTGIIEASSIHQEGGTIVLDGGDNGVSLGGTLAATGTNGGTISIKAGSITTSGKIDASAIGYGNGGNITAVASDAGTYGGTILAKGGQLGGNGGTVETSGHTITFDNVQVDTTAPLGKTGTWLLDPYDLTINAADGAAIANALATNNVTLQTTASNTGASGFGTVGANGGGDIIDNGAISWNSANSLTLSAYRNISVNAGISDSGAGNVILRADNTGNGTGTVLIPGSVSVGGTASLYYDPSSYSAPTAYAGFLGAAGTNAYMLVNTAAELAAVKNNLAGTYALGANIAVVGALAPIGTAATPFSGIFDGNGGIGQYTMGGLVATGTTNVGLFGNNIGTIRNVTVTSGAVSGLTNVGGIAGSNAGTIANSSFNGSVAGGLASQNIGGLVGYNSGSLSGGTASGAVIAGSGSTAVGGYVGNDYAGSINGGAATNTVSVGIGTISGQAGYNIGGFAGFMQSSVTGAPSFSGSVQTGLGARNVGGIAGFANGALLAGLTVNGTVSVGGGSSSIGGIAGFLLNSTIANSVFNGSIQAGNGSIYLGGIAGEVNSSSLLNVTGTGGVSVAGSANNLGGLAGYLDNASTISGGTALGAVLSGGNSGYVGGAIGNNRGFISNLTAANNVSAGTASSYIGGIAGYNTGTITGGVATTASTVTAGNNSVLVAGLVGDNAGGSILLGTANGAVQAGAGVDGVGGLAGYNTGMIQNSQFNGTLSAGTAANQLGGLVGINSGALLSSDFGGSLTASANTAEVGGIAGYAGGASLLSGDIALGGSILAIDPVAYLIGGLVGFNDTTSVITNSLAFEAVTGGKGDVGGYIGYNGGTVSGISATNSVTLADGVTNVGGIIGFNAGTLNGASANQIISIGNNSQAIGGLVGYNLGTVSGGSANNGVLAGNNDSYVAGGIGWNDGAGTVAGVAVGGFVVAGSYGTAVGGIVGLNGSDPRNTASGAFAATGPLLTGSTFAGAVVAGTNSFAVGGIAGWDSAWTVGHTGTGPLVYGRDTNNSGSGAVTADTGSFQVRSANQVGCAQNNGCVGTAGTDILYVTATAGQSQVYGSADANYSYTVSPLRDGDTLNQAITGGILSRAAGSAVGSYAITQGSLMADSQNYTIAYTGSNMAITPASLTVTAANTSRLTGQANPAFTATFSGLVNGDTSASLPGLAFSTSATASSPSGNYAVTPYGINDLNYSIRYVAGTMVITNSGSSATGGITPVTAGTGYNR